MQSQIIVTDEQRAEAFFAVGCECFLLRYRTNQITASYCSVGRWLRAGLIDADDAENMCRELSRTKEDK